MRNVVWVGVALRDDAGNIMAWEITENPHVTIQISTVPMDRSTFLGLLQRGEMLVDLDISIQGRARDNWTAGAEDARRHTPKGIESGPRSIGDGSYE